MHRADCCPVFSFTDVSSMGRTKISSCDSGKVLEKNEWSLKPRLVPKVRRGCRWPGGGALVTRWSILGHWLISWQFQKCLLQQFLQGASLRVKDYAVMWQQLGKGALQTWWWKPITPYAIYRWYWSHICWISSDSHGPYTSLPTSTTISLNSYLFICCATAKSH